MASETRVVGARRVGAPFAVGVIAVLGTLPVVTAVGPVAWAPQWLVVVALIAGGVVGVGVAAAVGAMLSPDVGLRALAPERLPGGGFAAYRRPVVAGVGVALLTVCVHAVAGVVGVDPGPLLWTARGSLAVLTAVAGGVVAELLVRFGVMTAVVWTAWTYRPAIDQGVTRAAVWGGILVAALAGGVGSLAVAVVWGDPGVATVIFPVGGGVVFGVLYWRYDLAAAVVAHAVASLLRATVAVVVG